MDKSETITNPKELMFDYEARKKLSDGISKIAQTIQHTLGPKNRSTGLVKKGGSHLLTSDGGYILKELILPDQFENLGAGLAIEVAIAVKEESGDGVTTSIILIDTAVREGIRMIEAGFKPLAIRRGLNKGIKLVLEYLNSMSVLADRTEIIDKVARTSSGGNDEIAHLVTSAFLQTDEKGFVAVESSKQRKSVVETIEGLQFPTDRLGISYLAKQHDSNTIENAYVLNSDFDINSIHELLPLLQMMSQEKKALIIICKSMKQEVLASLAANEMQGLVHVTVLSIKIIEKLTKGWLYDLVTFSGGVPVTEESGHDLRKISKNHLGFCNKVIVGDVYSTFIGGKGSKADRERRSSCMTAPANDMRKLADQDTFKKRQAMLESTVSVIKLGAESNIELRYKKILCKDCVNAVKNALTKGVLPGGGTALLRAAAFLETQLPSEEAERAGMQIIINSCRAPFLQLMVDRNDRACLHEEILQQSNPFFGFNLLSEKVENLYEIGVLDPTPVVVKAFEKALNAAAVILLTNVVIGDAQPSEK